MWLKKPVNTTQKGPLRIMHPKRPSQDHVFQKGPLRIMCSEKVLSGSCAQKSPSQDLSPKKGRNHRQNRPCQDHAPKIRPRRIRRFQKDQTATMWYAPATLEGHTAFFHSNQPKSANLPTFGTWNAVAFSRALLAQSAARTVCFYRY